jgi:hypothetical protein
MVNAQVVQMPKAKLLAVALAAVVSLPAMAGAGAPARHAMPRIAIHRERARVGPPAFARREFARDFRRFDHRGRFFDDAYWPLDYAPTEYNEAPPSEAATAPIQAVASAPYNAAPVCPVVWRWAKGQASRHSSCD